MAERDALTIRNVGAIATGDAGHPLADGAEIHIIGGHIASLGDGPRADTTLDAGGMLLAPGLWDAHARPYFGDHTPHFEARGYLDATVRAGTTAVVSPGTLDLPGRPRDAVGARELAILSQRSWVHDRPMDLKVYAGAIVAAPGLAEADFARAASCGVTRVTFFDPLDTVDEALRQATWARAHGMRVVVHCGGQPPIAGATLLEALRALDPDIALAANGGRNPPSEDAIGWLVERSGCAVDLDLMGSLRQARRIASRLVERGDLERVVVGTATPSPLAIAPAGVRWMAQQLVGATPLVTPALAIAWASGNTARAYALPGGRIVPQAPADLILCRPSDRTRYRDAVEAFADGWFEIDTVLIGGAVQLIGEAVLGRKSAVRIAAT